MFEPNDKFFPYFATWDLESFQVEINNNNNQSRLQCACEHVPASISVASNVPGYESANCFVTNGNSEQLVREFVEYVHEISDITVIDFCLKNSKMFLLIWTLLLAICQVMMRKEKSKC